MKHFVDEICNNKAIKYLDGSSHKPLHHKFHEDAFNFNLKYTVKIDWPQNWFDWQKSTPVKDYPMTVFTEIDLEHCVRKPVAFQPARTAEKIEYFVHIISNE